MNILVHIFLIILLIQDLLYKEVEEQIIRIIFILAIIKLVLYDNYIVSYISLSIYVLPFYIMYIVSTYLNKELVGLGDFKMIIIFAILISSDDILKLITFYLVTYLFAFIYSIIVFKKTKYIPLIPWMYLGYIYVMYI
ncbi:prepilin peptidase [Oceanivirga miroungae]|nr:prepilin peptidase [Oceanivirga miroungae]